MSDEINLTFFGKYHKNIVICLTMEVVMNKCIQKISRCTGIWVLIVILLSTFFMFNRETFARETSAPSLSVTSHKITIDGKILSYTATAGFIPIREKKTNQVTANIFFISYTKDGVKNTSTRPLTFAFNGGPGAASMFLHLGAFGPRIAPRSPDGTTLLPPPYKVMDNPNTLLDFTDLVFIDPVGTGYSHTVGDYDPHHFWGVKEDILSVTEFIRQFLTSQGRLLSPIFIMGESYGGVRSAGLAKYLQNTGIYPLGIIMISPVLDLENIQWSSMGDRAILLTIPTYTAIAWYHKKIAPRLQGEDLATVLEEVRTWTRDELLPAFWEGNAISAEKKQTIAKRMAEYIGVPQEWILQQNFRIREDDYAGEILRKEGKSISVYDGRVTALGPYTGDENDQIMFNYSGPLKTAIVSYLRRELNFTTDREYMSGNPQVYLDWNWESGRQPAISPDTINPGYPDAGPFLAQALSRCSFLKVFIASGVFDLECPYDSVVYSINHLNLPPERLRNITIKIYPGGHMVYMNPIAQRKLKNDLKEFYRQVLMENRV